VNNIQVINTGDGSSSLLNLTLNETYHSTHGAIQESNHIFIKNGLQYFTEKNKPSSISIIEVGFGTGLNVLLTLKESIEKKINIRYTSLEAFPISEKLVAQLNYPERIDLAQSEKFFNQIHTSEWNTQTQITSDFFLEKRLGSILEMIVRESEFDLVFFDAFAPIKQPEMWSLLVLQKMTASLKLGGVFVTYCAQGQLKRNLKSLGLTVESLPGPPGKREMVRALK
jgi:tRNA U34 5-methylaminomethyl-2-thiouridine-forming methyltransferase MnmC